MPDAHRNMKILNKNDSVIFRKGMPPKQVRGLCLCSCAVSWRLTWEQNGILGRLRDENAASFPFASMLSFSRWKNPRSSVLMGAEQGQAGLCWGQPDLACARRAAPDTGRHRCQKLASAEQGWESRAPVQPWNRECPSQLMIHSSSSCPLLVLAKLHLKSQGCLWEGLNVHSQPPIMCAVNGNHKFNHYTDHSYSEWYAFSFLTS